MSLKLVLDCSAPTLFIGYIYGDNLKIYSFAEAKHSITLFPLIEQILAENGFNVLDISDIYCVVGPGSFTGVRIGVSAANAMGLKDSVNLYPINKLDVLAYKNIECDRLSLIDAKHGNYYYGAYKKGEYFAFNTDECDTSFKRQYYTEVKICDTEIDADEYADLLINFVKNAPIEKTKVLSPMYLKLSQAEREREVKVAEYTICKMQQKDVERVMEIEKQSFPDYLVLSADTISNDIDNPLGQYYVIKKDDFVFGYGGFLTIADEAHIMDIAIEKAHRSNGYGKKMLAYLIDKAKALNLSALTLEVNQHNAVAISLYESVGFEKSGVRPKYYDGVDDAYLYWLKFDKQ